MYNKSYETMMIQLPSPPLSPYHTCEKMQTQMQTMAGGMVAYPNHMSVMTYGTSLPTQTAQPIINNTFNNTKYVNYGQTSVYPMQQEQVYYQKNVLQQQPQQQSSMLAQQPTYIQQQIKPQTMASLPQPQPNQTIPQQQPVQALPQPIEAQFANPTTKDDIYREKFLDYIYNGVKFVNAQGQEEIIPYEYFIRQLHTMGSTMYNQKNEQTIKLRVYEIAKSEENASEAYQEFWVHPLFLSLQSFELFKLFEDLKTEKEEDVVEIEVPSLDTFANLLKWIYTGDFQCSNTTGLKSNIDYFSMEQIISLFQ